MSQPSPFPLDGVRVRTHPASWDQADDQPRERGRIVLEFPGPPEATIVGVEVGGRLVFRRLSTECEVHLGDH